MSAVRREGEGRTGLGTLGGVRPLLLLLILLASPALAQDGVPALAPGQTVVDPDEDGRISGEILDARTGSPVAEAVIALYHPRSVVDRQWPEPWVPDFPAEDDAPIATVRAASEGQFLFDGLSPGRYRLSPLLGPKTQVTTMWFVLTRERPSEFAALRTNAGALLEGRVTTADGAPFAGIFVYVAAIDDGPEGNRLGGRRPSPRGLTDDDGRFSLGDVPPGRLKIQAGRQDFGFSELLSVEAGMAQDIVGLELVVPDERERIERARAERGGLGVVVDFDTGGVLIRRLLPGFPAEEAALRPGDRILALDGRSTRWMIRFEFFNRALGGIGEPITLTIGRDDEAPFDVTLTRAQMPER